MLLGFVVCRLAGGGVCLCGLGLVLCIQVGIGCFD